MRFKLIRNNLGPQSKFFSSNFSLAESAREILQSADPRQKTSLTHAVKRRWQENNSGALEWEIGHAEVPQYYIGCFSSLSESALIPSQSSSKASSPNMCWSKRTAFLQEIRSHYHFSLISLSLTNFLKIGVPLVVYLLHNLAHIELNAVDLCWDVIVRFNHENVLCSSLCIYCFFFSLCFFFSSSFLLWTVTKGVLWRLD